MTTTARKDHKRAVLATKLDLLYAEKERRDLCFWAERHYFIPETLEPIRLLPHQKAVLRYAFQRNAEGRFLFDTVVYSTPKKGGKTTIGGLMGRWAAETWGRYGEVLYVGNDADQAKERGFQSLRQSIELSPGYLRSKQELPGRWMLQSVNGMCLSTGTKVKAIATDYQGEAGANPIITLWEELWGFIHKDALRFWAEIAPSPTQLNSVRIILTYAGYEGESELLEGIYRSAIFNGRQLTTGEIGPGFDEAPNPQDKVPCWVNEQARMFAYWDSGERSRRMPWQQGDRGSQYYASESATQTPQQFRRLHLNEWVSSESEFIPIEWWDMAARPPLPLKAGDGPMVIALDAAVTGDCFGLIMVSRDPENLANPAVRLVRKWDPPHGGAIDYAGPRDVVRQLCQDFNVVEVCYDPYQLVDFAQQFKAEGLTYFHQFDQGQDRLEADKQLYDLISHRRVRHAGEPELREHLLHANAKQSKDEDTKLRLVKKSANRKIDLAVSLSMACHECLRLNLA